VRRGGWEPLRELEAMQNEMRRVLGQISGLGQAGGDSEGAAWLPALDVSETESEIVLVLDLPGVPQDGIDVEVDEGALTISGTRERRSQEGERFYRVERRFGTFSRNVPLPPGVDEARIRADLRDGVLEVRIPKPEEPQPRRIRIGVSGAVSGEGAGPPG
jgi:HSP20 family protein